MNVQRAQERAANVMRPVQIKTGVVANAAGSVEISFGGTRVLCTASFEERVPPHALERRIGWLTAEYSMLPGATTVRTQREASKGRLSGRTQEIQRLIGRALRAVVDLKSLEGLSVWIDCDVLEADGGTRTASITGAYVALVQALKKLNQTKKRWPTLPLLEQVAAVSAGVVGGECLLDLDYLEDSRAGVDMNLVMCESGRIIEIQATAEDGPFSEAQLENMRTLAQKGIQELFAVQKRAIELIGTRDPTDHRR